MWTLQSRSYHRHYMPIHSAECFTKRNIRCQPWSSTVCRENELDADAEYDVGAYQKTICCEPIGTTVITCRYTVQNIVTKRNVRCQQYGMQGE